MREPGSPTRNRSARGLQQGLTRARHSRAMTLRSVLRRGVALLAGAGAALAFAQEAAAPLPGFAALEAAGARIGEIRIVGRPIFDTADPQEDKLLFRWANALHVQTRPSVIESALLFKRGDPVSVAVIEETERLLHAQRYLYEVTIRPVAVADGVVDIEVETRDTWTLDPGFSASRAGGANNSGLQLKDFNLLGTGTSFSIGRSRTVDRSSTELQFANERAFGGWTSVAYSLSQNSDGRRDAATIEQPFYALDSRWAAGVSGSRDRRLDAIYRAGEVESQYRHREQKADIYGGWSTGRVDGWVDRYSLGLSWQDDRYGVEPDLAAPPALPPDQRLAGPFVRFERIKDRYEKLQNRNLIARPEYFALGLQTSVQLGWAATSLGSTRNALLYRANASRGFEPAPGQTLVLSAALDGQHADGSQRRQRLGGTAQYYVPQGPHWLFYAAAAGDVLRHPEIGDALQLGGDNGLRGFPLRYQNGNRRMLFTLEERAFSDLYVARLFRLGAAAFVDVGRAWGGDAPNPAAPGWLANAGLGLRIASVRSAFGNVLHVDLAAPLNAPEGIKRLQFLVKTKASF